MHQLIIDKNLPVCKFMETKELHNNTTYLHNYNTTFGLVIFYLYCDIHSCQTCVLVTNGDQSLHVKIII